MSRLANKVALITASSSGVGRAIALAFAAQGAKLVVCADIQPAARAEIVEEADAKPTHELIQAMYGEDRAVFVKTDAVVEEDVKACVEEGVRRGGGRLDVLVNVVGGDDGPTRVHETSLESWEKVVSLNLRSTFLFSKAGLGQFLAQPPDPTTGQRGNIINMASIFGLVAHAEGAAYDASKAAVVNFTKAVALQYAGDKIRCNAICPSFIYTALTKPYFDQPEINKLIKEAVPLWRDSGAQDVAHAAVFLASGVEAGWITGVALPVDGGTVAR